MSGVNAAMELSGFDGEGNALADWSVILRRRYSGKPDPDCDFLADRVMPGIKKNLNREMFLLSKNLMSL
ncbi:hypothetical protein BDD43_4434 [Mucilaginibacter gracilis]|uniref:Uncharacterized protein n=1 Tax=Mucilaginibacter gracilis TaxID=423350 RepID=A0A495J5D9_9SPHI|nr:hypothetical protein BDD43_4434 [Mucilaginibacter gracilis]